ncbi:uncharacterized protein [Elaeis guineensis]|uniref:uncharacterized protein n=1 Tax=Elaeis guineensis var. tenera TaxID=51953 RepID=UPI003C6DAA27
MEDDRNEYRLCAFVLAPMQRLYRGWRNRLHDLYKKFRTDEERLANIPEDVTPEDWKYMMAYFSSDAFQKVSKRNAANRAKLVTKHTCGTRSYAEVEESTRDPETGEKALPDQVWLIQHTKKNKEGELVWSDPKSKEIHEQLEEVVQQTQENESQMTRDDILLQVLGQKSGYFRGKGAGKKAPSKRVRYNENVQEEVQRAVEQAKESLVDSIREDVRAQLQDEVRAEIQAQMEEQVNEKVNAMIQARFAAFFETFSQSRASSCSRHEP